MWMIPQSAILSVQPNLISVPYSLKTELNNIEDWGKEWEFEVNVEKFV